MEGQKSHIEIQKETIKGQIEATRARVSKMKEIE